MSEIVNKVANSGLITLNLEHYLPKDIMSFDLKPYLFMELILKEKDFRQALKDLDWSVYKNKTVTLFCSVDAIIPHWAYMLVAAYLKEETDQIHFGSVDTTRSKLFIQNIQALDVSGFTDKRMVIKGCGEEAIGTDAYVEITQKLQPVALSIMYGEPCSTVPIFKQKKKTI